MNRRRFLSLLSFGAPAAVVAEKLGLAQRIRTYFFAPAGGWMKPQFDFDSSAGAGVLTSVVRIGERGEVYIADLPFYLGQSVRILSSDLSVLRGGAKVNVISDSDRFLMSFDGFPPGVQAGDLILLES